MHARIKVLAGNHIPKVLPNRRRYQRHSPRPWIRVVDDIRAKHLVHLLQHRFEKRKAWVRNVVVRCLRALHSERLRIDDLARFAEEHLHDDATVLQCLSHGVAWGGSLP